MSRPASPVVCDGCGKQKQEANRWWIIGVTAAQTMGNSPCLLLVPFSSTPFDERFKLFDFCGRECAVKFISMHMETV
jgi:hypothetical protein